MFTVIVFFGFFGAALSADDSIKFLLNDKSHQGPDNRIYIGANNASSFVDVNLPTIFLAHGYTETPAVYYYTDIPAAFLLNRNCNIIGMDWSKLAAGYYWDASINTALAGDGMGELIVSLHATGLDLAKVHLIGHSLGGHVIGFAGKYVYANLSLTIGRITALDPAGPLFQTVIFYPEDYRLYKTDAKDVVVLHTDQTEFGFFGDLGTVDFYANGGIAFQPGCLSQIFTTYYCSHQISVKFFITSINSQIYLATCSALDSNECSNNTLIFGPDVPSGSTGSYAFSTQS